MPNLAPEQITALIQGIQQYIAGRQAAYRPRAVSLTQAQKAALSPFFRADVLENARLLEFVGNEKVPEPAFYPVLKAAGFANLPDLPAMHAITFIDTISFQVPINPELLFHELVHVEQYRQLGLEGFSDLYGRGFLSGGSYEAIPLELHAYYLQLLTRSGKSFSVETAFADEISHGRI
jgi:hypothetical protein